ncbi:hypothetical protein HDV00_001078 [Rhizophlyctis rosea]|nr:hypothetical protein HDV00_001078 [Rhizophlyctis rosea]
MIALAHSLDLTFHFTPATEQHSQIVSGVRRSITANYHNSSAWRHRFRKRPTVTNVELAVWASHARIWKDVVTRELPSALVLEDDVDAETFTPRVVSYLHSKLPAEWDMLYLGHCDNPPGKRIAARYGYRLHVATHPSCTHAYAVSQKGASKLLELLTEPVAAVDDELVGLVIHKSITAYSVHPPLINQRQKDPTTNPSDILEHNNRFLNFFHGIGNGISGWVRGVETKSELVDPVLVGADFAWAREWMWENESGAWKAGREQRERGGMLNIPAAPS